MPALFDLSKFILKYKEQGRIALRGSRNSRSARKSMNFTKKPTYANKLTQPIKRSNIMSFALPRHSPLLSSQANFFESYNTPEKLRNQSGERKRHRKIWEDGQDGQDDQVSKQAPF